MEGFGAQGFKLKVLIEFWVQLEKLRYKSSATSGEIFYKKPRGFLRVYLQSPNKLLSTPSIPLDNPILLLYTIPYLNPL